MEFFTSWAFIAIMLGLLCLLVLLILVGVLVLIGFVRRANRKDRELSES